MLMCAPNCMCESNQRKRRASGIKGCKEKEKRREREQEERKKLHTSDLIL